MRKVNPLAAAILVSASGVFISASAMAATVWTNWTQVSIGAPGSAAGTLDGIGVTYSGAVIANGTNIAGASNIWAPNSSWIGGTSTASPSVVNDSLGLSGTGTATINFASPIVNPLFAIWSLGQPGSLASFTFGQTPTFQVGGPNAQFGGSAIAVAGNTVSGNEGNGVVQFTGTLSSITFTSTPEFYYAWTVGTASPTVIPEPGTQALFALGLAGLVGLGGRRLLRARKLSAREPLR